MTPSLWTSRSAGIVRAALVPPAMLFQAGTAIRRRLYAAGIRSRYRPPVPTVCVGNLSVGGTGKTPVAQWVARFAIQRGIRPAVLLRGHGADEVILHRTALPEASVVADANRPRGARRAVAAGAEALILDDGFQRLDILRDLDIVLVSADQADAVDWPLPAGPWREPWTALRRADCVIVTRKAASEGDVAHTVGRVVAERPDGPVAVARLSLGRLERLRTRRTIPATALAGRRVLAIAGIGDPRAFARQLEALGATVDLAARPDHHAYPYADIRRLRRAAEAVDYVAVTAKDAVKLASRWPRDAPEPVVAGLEITWERGRAALEAALAHTFTAPAQHRRRVGGGRQT